MLMERREKKADDGEKEECWRQSRGIIYVS